MEKQNQTNNPLTSLSSIQNQKLRVLWWSNAVHTQTGYGVQTNNCVYRLAKQGYDIRVAANYGLEGAALGFNNVIQYPHLFSEFGEDTLKLAVDFWHPHVLVTLYDIWVGKYSRFFNEENWISKLHPRWIAWLPVDSEPVADGVAEQAGKAYRAVAMSQFGQRELKKAGVSASYIPHGVEAQVFKPSPDKKTSKQWLEKHSAPINLKVPCHINNEDYVVGVNKANKDPARADYDRMLLAYKIFLENNPDARVDSKMFLHTWCGFPGGTPIRELCHKYGLEGNVKSTFEYDLMCGLTPQAMAMQYGAFDVLLNLARGEGFGVPILEAASCGVPSVATDFSSMTELVSGHGWLIPPYASEYHGGVKLRNGLSSLWALPDEYKAADALEDAYNHPEKVKRFGEDSRRFALGYDFDTTVIPLWRDLLGEVESELGMFGNAKNKDDAYEALYRAAAK